MEQAGASQGAGGRGQGRNKSSRVQASTTAGADFMQCAQTWQCVQAWQTGLYKPSLLVRLSEGN